jgi:ribosomal protein S18 acetylase RimI-like enzyme
MPEIEVRTAYPEDFEILSAFEHSYHSEYVWQMNLDIESTRAQADFRRIRLPRQVFVAYPRERSQIFTDSAEAEAFLVAILDNKPVGYIRIEAEKTSKVARISDLVISAPMRRQGIASGLMLAAMDLASHRHFHTVMIEMQSKNDPAITMATKLGFTFSGFRDHYFPNQELALFFSRIAR